MEPYGTSDLALFRYHLLARECLGSFGGSACSGQRWATRCKVGICLATLICSLALLLRFQSVYSFVSCLPFLSCAGSAHLQAHQRQVLQLGYSPWLRSSDFHHFDGLQRVCRLMVAIAWFYFSSF